MSRVLNGVNPHLINFYCWLKRTSPGTTKSELLNGSRDIAGRWFVHAPRAFSWDEGASEGVHPRERRKGGGVPAHIPKVWRRERPSLRRILGRAAPDEDELIG